MKLLCNLTKVGASLLSGDQELNRQGNNFSFFTKLAWLKNSWAAEGPGTTETIVVFCRKQSPFPSLKHPHSVAELSDS